jgi:hypothetical protein
LESEDIKPSISSTALGNFDEGFVFEVDEDENEDDGVESDGLDFDFFDDPKLSSSKSFKS